MGENGRIPWRGILLPVEPERIRRVSVGRVRRRVHLEIRTAEDPPRRLRIFAGIQNKDHADRLARDLRQVIADGELPSRTVRLSEFRKEYLEWAKLHRRKKTYEKYRTALRLFEDCVGDLPLSALRRSHILTFSESRRRDGVVGRTVNNQVKDLQIAFARAVLMGYLRSNPAEKIPKATEEGGRGMRVYSAEEIAGLLRVAPVWRRRVYRFLLATGFRLNEMTALEWDWIDLRRGRCTVYRTKATARNDKRPDTVPLSSAALEVMEEVRAEWDPSWGPVEGQVFRRPDGRVLDHHFLRDLKRDATEAKVPATTVHAFRYTFGTRLAEFANPKTLQKLLRHRDMRDTFRYYVLVDEDQQRAALEEAAKRSDEHPG